VRERERETEQKRKNGTECTKQIKVNDQNKRKYIMIWNLLNHCLYETYDQYEVKILVIYIVILVLNRI